MHSSSKLFAVVSCLAFALGGCAANPSVGSATMHTGPSGVAYSGGNLSHDVTSDYKPAAIPSSSAGRQVASNGAVAPRTRIEGVGGGLR
jgi:hypothetical protein